MKLPAAARPTPAPPAHVIAAAKYLLAEREVGQDGFAGALKKYDTTVLAAADDLLTAGLLRAEDEGAASGSEGTPGALELGKGWLGASPDGLLDEMGDLLGSKYYDRSIGRGVLEIKCPHKLRMGVPKNIPSYWYMPQAQGLMEILQRDWCDFYTWTPNGSVIHRVERDVRYWEALEDVLGRFWFEKVVPAREAVAAGMSQEEVRAKYQPQLTSNLAIDLPHISPYLPHISRVSPGPSPRHVHAVLRTPKRIARLCHACHVQVRFRPELKPRRGGSDAAAAGGEGRGGCDLSLIHI